MGIIALDSGPRSTLPAGTSPPPPGRFAVTRTRVIIGGGGIAALEAALALRELAGRRIALTLVSPRRDVVLPPPAVRTPFGGGRPPRWPLADIARDLDARCVRAEISAVDADAHRVRLSDGRELDYDLLLLAPGARPRPPFRQVVTFGGEADTTALAGVVADLEEGWSHSVAFVVPPGAGWSMPAYELALLTARQLSSMCIDDARITVVTPEERPLALFGQRASATVARVLARAGVAVERGAYVDSVISGRALSLAPGGRLLPVQRVVALPCLSGPRIDGLPHDDDGFLPVDPEARVLGVDDVFAAGDATDFPIKQGGIATQQADAAAERIASAAGAAVTPVDFRPRIEAWLVTDARCALHLSSPIAGGGGAAAEPEWVSWPSATKVAGRHLQPWLAAQAGRARPPALSTWFG